MHEKLDKLQQDGRLTDDEMARCLYVVMAVTNLTVAQDKVVEEIYDLLSDRKIGWHDIQVAMNEQNQKKAEKRRMKL
jgi:hypothetical protein